jgi:hypothetical protein
MMAILRHLRRQGAIVALLALVASAPSLGNGFVYDDVPIIQQNPAVRQLESVGRIWSSPYWPAGLLYRPVTVQLFAAEWALGGGRPAAFHVVSVLLKVLTAVLLWRLARRLLPPLPALAAAALFAVHPVHAESVANVVGQAELWATGLTLLALERYLTWRVRGPLGARHRISLAVLTLLAIFSKETGYVIPLLLAGTELLLAAPDLPWRRRLAILAPVMQWQGAVVVGAILIRIIVLGPTAGAGPAMAFQGLKTGERIAGMLAVVPEWARLLLWPAHLQAEYGPPGIAVTGPIGPVHLFGLGLLVAAAAMLALSWRQHPVIAFGFGWVGVALFPVSNILTPTGVILAERTLFLPSAGAMLALGGVLAIVLPSLKASRAPVRTAGGLILGSAVLAGMLRSIERQPVWKEPLSFVRRLETDAPATYRAHLVAMNYYSSVGREEEAVRAGARAYALFKGDPHVFEEYGQALRRQRRCGEALPVLADGVERLPDRTVLRARLIECALAMGDTARARAVAADGVRRGRTEFENTLRRLEPRIPGLRP